MATVSYKKGDGRNICKVCEKSVKGKDIVRIDNLGRGNFGRPLHACICSKCLIEMVKNVCKGKGEFVIAELI